LAINVLFAGIPVADLDAAIDWYERLFGAAPDMAPNDTERTWRLTDASWVYVVADLDARLAAIRERGIEVGEIEEINEKTRKAEIVDPEGNRIGFGQVG
jgi:predicted enzyme related to lactoylglutathione lyase